MESYTEKRISMNIRRMDQTCNKHIQRYSTLLLSTFGLLNVFGELVKHGETKFDLKSKEKFGELRTTPNTGPKNN